jgi:hypothetical protein
MPTSLIDTGVQFPDNSIQTTAATGGGGYALQVYVSPATWTKPAGLKAVKVTVVGAGGNGAASTASPNPNPVAGARGGGGGGGGVAIESIQAPSIPGPVSVTAGPGTNSFGPFCSATAGGNASPAPAPSTSAGGSAGAGSGGNLNISGTSGGPGAPGFSPERVGAGGQNAVFSEFVPGQNNAVPGVNASFYGNGGGGAGARSNSTGGVGTSPGGTGAPGVVIVEEFY